VSAILSSADNTIEIGELKGNLFGEASISEVRLSDRHGSWLVVRGIFFAWSPSQLFAARLSVAHLRIDSVSVLRKPEGEPEAKEKAGTVDLAIPVKIAFGDFGVKTLDISELLAGEQTRLRITGSTNINDTSSSNACA
jgi:autotransporter translocation and assembly factor TamB